MKIKTSRFGELQIGDGEKIYFPEGIPGFSDLKHFCLVDPAEDTLILWLQSMENPLVAFPVLEPKLFKSDYMVSLSMQELRLLQLENIQQSIVLTILTIPQDVTQMTANLKAPIVINLKRQIGKQVVLQESEYSVKHLMFMELKARIMAMRSTIQGAKSKTDAPTEKPSGLSTVDVRSMVPCQQVKML